MLFVAILRRYAIGSGLFAPACTSCNSSLNAWLLKGPIYLLSVCIHSTDFLPLGPLAPVKESTQRPFPATFSTRISRVGSDSLGFTRMSRIQFTTQVRAHSAALQAAFAAGFDTCFGQWIWKWQRHPEVQQLHERHVKSQSGVQMTASWCFGREAQVTPHQHLGTGHARPGRWRIATAWRRLYRSTT